MFGPGDPETWPGSTGHPHDPRVDLCPDCEDDCTCAEDVRAERAIDAYEDRGRA